MTRKRQVNRCWSQYSACSWEKTFVRLRVCKKATVARTIRVDLASVDYKLFTTHSDKMFAENFLNCGASRRSGSNKNASSLLQTFRRVDAQLNLVPSVYWIVFRSLFVSSSAKKKPFLSVMIAHKFVKVMRLLFEHFNAYSTRKANSSWDWASCTANGNSQSFTTAVHQTHMNRNGWGSRQPLKPNETVLP